MFNLECLRVSCKYYIDLLKNCVNPLNLITGAGFHLGGYAQTHDIYSIGIDL
jgi:hypothetical protein